MEIEMKYIYEVYKNRSFSKAAEVLYVTQPTLSLAVKRIEKELGIPIFERKKNPLTLTPAGEIYIDKINKIMQIEQDLQEELNDIRELNVGNLSIGGTNYINSFVLPPIISKFTNDYPNIKLSVIEASSDRLLKLVDEYSIDITFISGKMDESKFSYFEGFEDEISLAIPNVLLKNKDEYKQKFSDKEWKLGKVNVIEVKDIALFSNIPFILLKPKNNLYDRSVRIFEEANVQPRVVQSVEQLATAYRFCLEGIGATFVGSKLLEAEDKIDERITIFSIDSDIAIRVFSAVINKNRYLSNSINEFIKRTQDYYL